MFTTCFCGLENVKQWWKVFMQSEGLMFTYIKDNGVLKGDFSEYHFVLFCNVTCFFCWFLNVGGISVSQDEYTFYPFLAVFLLLSLNGLYVTLKYHLSITNSCRYPAISWKKRETRRKSWKKRGKHRCRRGMKTSKRNKKNGWKLGEKGDKRERQRQQLNSQRTRERKNI